MDTVETLQADLKRERHWRVNATKVAERHKVRVDKLTQENVELKQEYVELTAILAAVGARANYLIGEVLKANPSFKLPDHLRQ